jgi:hypothetical protein
MDVQSSSRLKEESTNFQDFEHNSRLSIKVWQWWIQNLFSALLGLLNLIANFYNCVHRPSFFTCVSSNTITRNSKKFFELNGIELNRVYFTVVTINLFSNIFLIGTFQVACHNQTTNDAIFSFIQHWNCPVWQIDLYLSWFWKDCDCRELKPRTQKLTNFHVNQVICSN